MFVLRSITAMVVLSISLLAVAQTRAESVEIGNVEEIHLALYGTVLGGDSERLYENDHVYVDE